MNFKSLALLLTVAAAPQAVMGGPLAYGICQTGCNCLAVACYAGAGFTFGVPIPGSTPAAIMACNAGLGTCMAACAAIALTPTP
ncbi:cysteine-rich protein [Suillus spraguei]|nr:cysteine-rich protein [Suillus spraguei]KAG2353627.1 cysteine-rich protein [Suillus spraguei]KAG2358768.1 cysteine-rich protein [Suillus spraguei]